MFVTIEIDVTKIEKVTETEKTKIVKGIETTSKIVIVPIIETKILPEIVIVREEIAKGRDHAVALAAATVQREDVDPDPGNKYILYYIYIHLEFDRLIS